MEADLDQMFLDIIISNGTKELTAKVEVLRRYVQSQLEEYEDKVKADAESYDELVETCEDLQSQLREEREKSKKLMTLWHSLAEIGEIRIGKDFMKKYDELTQTK